jgi:uncharacterized protein
MYPERQRTVAATVGVLAVANVASWLYPRRAALVIGPASSALLIGVARRSGLSWKDLGLGRRSWRRGAKAAGGAIGLVATVFAVGAALPVTRPAFLDPNYRADAGRALFNALVVVPLGTVVPEEVGFRGVLWAAQRREHGVSSATVWSSVAFGLWHVLPTLSQANPALVAVAGQGGRSKVAVVGGGVVFTGLASVLFCELRRRTGSLLAPAGLHWATNGVGVLLSAVVLAVHERRQREAARSRRLRSVGQR